MGFSPLHTLKVNLQVLEDVITRVREVMDVGENLADLSSLAPASHDMCGAIGAATGIAGVSLLAKKHVRVPGFAKIRSKCLT